MNLFVISACKFSSLYRLSFHFGLGLRQVQFKYDPRALNSYSSTYSIMSSAVDYIRNPLKLCSSHLSETVDQRSTTNKYNLPLVQRNSSQIRKKGDNNTNNKLCKIIERHPQSLKIARLYANKRHKL